MSSIEYTPPKSLLAVKDKSVVALELPGVDKYQDILDDPDIRPATIGGMWHPTFMAWCICTWRVPTIRRGWGPEILAKHMSDLNFLSPISIIFILNSQVGLLPYPRPLSSGVCS